MNKLALITGATSGIGEACSRLLAENGYDLIITGRRIEKLEKVKSELEAEYEIKVQMLCFDIRNEKEVSQAVKKIDKVENIDVLINNAGLAAGLHSIQEGDLNDWERMIDTNIKGLLYISKKIIPYLINKKSGHIVNIGSIAGRNVYAKGNVYCATKFAVDALTQGMRVDLLPYGIKVTQVSPGAVETEFSIVRFHGDTELAKNVYEGYEPLLANDIADAVLYAITRPPHVNINDLLIMPTAQADAYNLFKK